jgi:hypothetical protein
VIDKTNSFIETKEVNYIPYYLKVYEADSLYIIKDYKKSYDILDSLFKKHEPLQMANYYEVNNYYKLKIILNKKINIFDFSELISKYRLTDLALKNDSIFNIIYLKEKKYFDENYIFLRENFINFDDSVRDAINAAINAGSFFGLLGNKVDVGGTSYDIPSGTELIGPDKFIRFGTLMEIINKIGAISYQIGNKTIKMQINSKNTACRAFPRIFSADKKKLFIPNDKTPKFDLAKALETKIPQATYKENFKNGVKFGGTKVLFPNLKAIAGGE